MRTLISASMTVSGCASLSFSIEFKADSNSFVFFGSNMILIGVFDIFSPPLYTSCKSRLSLNAPPGPTTSNTSSLAFCSSLSYTVLTGVAAPSTKERGILFVKRLFRVNLTAVPTQQERYAIVKSFPSSWEVYEHWCDVDDLHKAIDYIEVFWFPSSSNPVFPSLPDYVTVTGIS